MTENFSFSRLESSELLRLLLLTLGAVAASWISVAYLATLVGLGHLVPAGLLAARLPIALLLLLAVPLFRAGFLGAKAWVLMLSGTIGAVTLSLGFLFALGRFHPSKAMISALPLARKEDGKKLHIGDMLAGAAAVCVVEIVVCGAKELFSYTNPRLEVAYLLAYAVAVVQLTALASKSNPLRLRDLGQALISIAGLAGFASGIALWL